MVPTSTAVFRRGLRAAASVASPRLLPRFGGLLLLLALLLPGFAHATVYYVDAARAGNGGDGGSWATAKRDVQAAINLATTAGDEVWVKAGTYLPTMVPSTTTTGTTAQDLAFYLINTDIKLYGGFAGTETTAGQRNPAAHLTTLSGDISVSDADAHHVLLTLGRSSACIVDGFTVRVSGSASGSASGGISVQPTTGAAVTVGRNAGGGMYNSSSSPTVSNCIFSANTSGLGGGMYNSSSSPTVSNCTFSANTATTNGGGMYNTGSSPTVSNCTFSANTTINSSLGGGGMFNTINSSPTVSNCIFSGNSANTTGSGTAGGGGICSTRSSPTVSNCTFSDNRARVGAALYYTTDAGGSLTNCILYQNTTPNNSTDANREELNKAGTTAALTVSSCIVRDAAGTAPALTVANATLSNCYTQAPDYVDAADADGPDNTWRTADDGLRLSCNSFAVDKGTGTTPATDILGNPRKGLMDLGAYEATGGTAPSATIPAATTTVSGVQPAAVLHYTDCQNELLLLNAAGPYTLRGRTSVTVRVQATAPTFNNQPYVRRFYDISPATDPATATAEVTLYFTQEDFTNYNASRGTYPPLPQDGADAAGDAANLRITQQHGSSATGAPGSYSGWNGSGPAAVLITPTAVTYNAAAARWEVTFPVTGFSGFFAHTGAAAPLPVELTQFTATLQGPAAVGLAWLTVSEQNSAVFEVQRSTDGKAFTTIGTVEAAGTSTSRRSYRLHDTRLPAGAAVLYYRLRQVDQDGTFSYSPVRPVSRSGMGLSLFPNPTAGATTLTGTQPGAAVSVLDALGRPVATATADAAGTAALRLPAGLPAGVYVVRSGSQAVRLTLE